MTRLYRREAILAHSLPHERHAPTVSQRKRADSALEEMARLLANQADAQAGERRLLEQLLAGIAEGVAIADAQGIIRQVNAAYSRLTGEAAAEAVGRHLNDPAGAPALPRLIASQLPPSTGDTPRWQGELPARRPDGQAYHLQVTLQAVRSPQGRLEHYLLILTG
jgi:PAS domain S-box-containing protein